ncbi:precorrin-3B C(17)-methyltransferase [Desulfonauticus submarinus]
MERCERCVGKGKLYVLGIGPGSREYRTLRAEKILNRVDVLVGYEKYIELIKDHVKGKEVISSGMKKEIWRVEQACKRVLEGKVVALISSGDAGIYGMAGLVLEVMARDNLKFDLEIVPGVSAGQFLAARVGAPLMLDFACISLSDLLVPWETIEKRLKALAKSDLVTVIYNPKSKKRTWQLKEALNIFSSVRGQEIWVAVGKNLSLTTEKYYIVLLKDLKLDSIDMRTTLIIGNHQTQKIGNFLMTLRGYSAKWGENLFQRNSEMDIFKKE